MMAVDIISPDARKKVDELFLYWLSEPSTQDLLRQEVAMVCGLQPDHRINASQGVHSKVRPMSPTARAITPPPSLPSLSPSPSLSRSSPRSRLQVPQVITTSEVTSIKPVEVDETDSPALPIIIKTSGEVSCIQSKPMSPIFVIPCFYFPNGKQVEGKEEEMAKIMINVGKIFERYPRQDVPLKDFHLIIEALKLPSYWKIPLFQAISGRRRKYANLALFKKVWTEIIETCHDDASKFVYLMTSSDPDRNHLIPSDFNQLIQDIVEYHPGLEFLRDAPEFHARYIETVIGRIFYKVDKTWKNRITIQDLRNSNFLQSLEMLSYEDDINRFTDFFSYEHFYVIYCKFWELDSDHDLLIDEHDLIRHADHSLTPKVVERLLSGVVTRDLTTPIGKMSYKDFVWFLISEEDKTTCRSIEYWFRILDKDGDGVLSIYELEYFYDDVLARLEELNIESLSFENTICQILDMINPRQSGYITLKDLKNSPLTPLFFNTFMNVEKYLDYEQRDAVSLPKDDEDMENPLSEWDRFANEQYELLVAEENDVDLMDDEDMASDNEMYNI